MKSKLDLKSRKSLQEMIQSLKSGKKIYYPSKYWRHLNKKHLEELDKYGLENMKIRQALAYFTFTVFNYRHEQFQYVLNHSSLNHITQAIITAIRAPYFSHFPLTRNQKMQFVFYNCLLWDFVKKFDNYHLLNIGEPTVGNPLLIKYGKEYISQDLANSVLETYSIDEVFNPFKNKKITILEIGGGYGRNAYVLKNLYQTARYICVDIPPALLIAQWYLTKVFPNKKIFKFQDFTSYKEVKNKIENADFSFLLPAQIELLPAKSIDLFININSFHEMFPAQIKAYFKQIDRLTKGIFYMKQWKISKIPFDNIALTSNSYPIRKHWKRIFKRESKVQTKFFEAAYEIDS